MVISKFVQGKRKVEFKPYLGAGGTKVLSLAWSGVFILLWLTSTILPVAWIDMFGLEGWVRIYPSSELGACLYDRVRKVSQSQARILWYVRFCDHFWRKWWFQLSALCRDISFLPEDVFIIIVLQSHSGFPVRKCLTKHSHIYPDRCMQNLPEFGDFSDFWNLYILLVLIGLRS